LTAEEKVPFFPTMPSPYKAKPYPLSNLVDGRMFVRIRCSYCKRTHHYFPSDLIRIFGDVDVDSLAHRVKCEGGKDHGYLDVRSIHPTGQEAVGMRIRRLVAIQFQRVPIWSED